MRPRNPGFAAIFAAWLFPVFAIAAIAAQETVAVPVTFVVSDETGGRIPNAQIALVPSPDPAPEKMTTDEDGQLSLILNAGGYALFVHSPGFLDAAMHVEVLKSKKLEIFPVVLKVGTGGGFTVHPVPLRVPNTLTLSVYPYGRTMAILPGYLKPRPHTSVTVHNSHTNTDET
jgi:hypothetical protein